MATTTKKQSELAEALGKGRKYTLGDKEVYISPIDLDHLCELEEKYGDLANLPLNSVRGQREILAFVTENFTEPKITNDELGKLIRLDCDWAQVIEDVLDMSGLSKKRPAPAAADQTEPEPTEDGESS